MANKTLKEVGAAAEAVGEAVADAVLPQEGQPLVPQQPGIVDDVINTGWALVTEAGLNHTHAARLIAPALALLFAARGGHTDLEADPTAHPEARNLLAALGHSVLADGAPFEHLMTQEEPTNGGD